MIPAAIQLMVPFQPTDPALDARAPVVATPAPALLLMRHPSSQLGTRLGPHHRRAPLRGGIPRVRGGVDTAIPGPQPRGAVAQAPMLVQTRRQLGILRRLAVQDSVPADEAALDCIPPADAAACGGL